MSMFDITKNGVDSNIVIGTQQGIIGGRMMKAYDLIIIGGGPAGLAAAVAARDNGIESILILERDKQLWRYSEPVYPQRFQVFIHLKKN